MTWYVKSFEDAAELQAWLRSTAILPANIKAIYYDTASSKHVAVYQA